jgi:subtilase family serine protease
MAAGQTTGRTCNYTYTYPHSGQSTYTKADANGDVHESDEDNNVRYLRVNVRPAA